MISKVYFINLDHRIDRKEHIEKLLTDSDLIDISERVPAIYNKSLPHAGCVLSHILTIEKFIESNEQYCLILEDDFITDNINTLKIDINKLFIDKIDFDIVQLAGNHIQLHDCEHTYLKKVTDSQTTSAYIISKNFANTLLNNFRESYKLISDFGRRHEYCLDIYWKKLQPISKWYCYLPALGYQMDSYSDIENINASYKC
jgi:GR25 family glycosyltransferase involved in LPS biosynthesis